MFDTPKYWQKPEDKLPDCDHHCGGDNWYSDICVCFMGDGTFELLRYFDGESRSFWNNENNKNVVAWMEL